MTQAMLDLNTISRLNTNLHQFFMLRESENVDIGDILALSKLQASHVRVRWFDR